VTQPFDKGLIDLHLHTTASDGLCTPRELVARAALGGVSVIAVTDHDTTAAVAEVRSAADEHGIEAITGIEITAVESGRDIHILGYFFDPEHEPLKAFLAAQRQARVARVEAIGGRLAALGMPVDIGPLVEEANRESGRSLGRPQVARAMVDAGHVADTRDAFDRWLGDGRPGFVPRTGARAEAVIDIIHRAGGLASLAHPGRIRVDPRIPELKDAGLDAIEAFHPDHDAALVDRYVGVAHALGLLLTGGSDFHGDPGHGLGPGSVTLPSADWDRLRDSRQHASR
jgi:predicted metal-dependent phosphoesterase TrpH